MKICGHSQDRRSPDRSGEKIQPASRCSQLASAAGHWQEGDFRQQEDLGTNRLRYRSQKAVRQEGLAAG
jgi:hypothetical protein